MKRSASPGDEDGPGQKHFAHPTQQVQGASTKKEARTIRCGEVVWSGKLEFHDVHKQKRFLSSCYVHSHEKINTVNWPKQLKMTTISDDDCWKLNDLRVKRTIQRVTFSMDEDCDKMSYRAFIQSTCTSRPNFGYALVEYTSSGIWLLSLRSCLLGDENVTLGFIYKRTYQDRTVELLTDFGILSHATTANMLAKENGRLKRELQQMDKERVQLQMLHKEENEMHKTRMAEKEKEQARMQRERDVMYRQTIEKDRALLRMKDMALVNLEEETERLQKEKEKMLVEQKHLVSKERTKIMAESLRNQERIRKEVEAEKTQETFKLTSQLIEIETSRSELENRMHTMQSKFECIICKQLLNKPTMLDCGHIFCDECIQTNRKEDVRCPNCRAWLETYKFRPCFIIGSCIEAIKEARRKESVMERKGESIQGELEVQSQSMSEESGDDPSPVSPSSSGSSASSYCRAPSSIEDMFTSDSSSDSN